MDSFLSAVQAAGLPGLIAGLFILVGLLLAKRSQLVVSGDALRVANMVLGVLLAGLPLLQAGAGVDSATLATAIASIGAALVYELLKWGTGKLAPKVG